MSDLIRREDAIKATWQEPTYTDPLNILTEVRDRIETIPSADRPSGEWKPLRGKYAECSACEEAYYMPHMRWSNYCPCCGARMKGADDE